MFRAAKGNFNGARDIGENSLKCCDGASGAGVPRRQSASRALASLTNQSVTRVGGTREAPIEARVVAATNMDLDLRERQGLFRRDLLYRLNTVQFVLPPLHAGWAVRRKSNHFAAYDEVATSFAKEIGIDPWRINPAFSVCRSVNFHERQGEECLAANVAAVLDIVREKYREYEIDETPYVVVKADAGTYGMGIMTVRNADEVIALNRKQRNKMSVGKEGLEVSEVIIQEGVHSFETLNEAVAEPVIYMIDQFVVAEPVRAQQSGERRQMHGFLHAGAQVGRRRHQPAFTRHRGQRRPHLECRRHLSGQGDGDRRARRTLGLVGHPDGYRQPGEPGAGQTWQ